MQAYSLIIAAALMLPAAISGCKAKQPAAEGTSKEEAAPQTAPAVKEPAPATTEAGPQLPPVKLIGGDTAFFVLERTACFGTCPTYRLTINGDGKAYYEGRRFVPREGRYAGQVDAAKMKALEAAAEQSGFFGLKDVYDAPVTDLPSLIIRFRTPERDKQVKGRVGTPKEFKELAVQLEEMLQGIEWTRLGDLD